ncbi:unnamed protein product [Brachionus calyciflorus]|uniref:Uncharacterized protein n=1 Tax=Brachionus calyciflorus TaxID=104777 RepID=A0A814DTW4_9BILA|nr:unnamed protein product [Brachionus calyciflorus]
MDNKLEFLNAEKSSAVYYGTSRPTDSNKCLVILPAQIECLKEYENLKDKATTIDSFDFEDEYRKSLMKLQTKLHRKDVAEFWVKESTAKSTCYAIRRCRKNQPEPKNTKNLNLDETEKFIKINGRDEFFLQTEKEF